MGIRVVRLLVALAFAACGSGESSPPAELDSSRATLCTSPPTFPTGAMLVATGTGNATCGIQLQWDPAVPGCGGTITYSIFRLYNSTFAASPTNQIAAEVSGTSFLDELSVLPSKQHFYAVRAVEHLPDGNQFASATLLRDGALPVEPAGGNCTPFEPPPWPAVVTGHRWDYTGPPVAGNTLHLIVTAYDALQRVATGYEATVEVITDDPQATLPTAPAFQSGVLDLEIVPRTSGIRPFRVITHGDPVFDVTSTILLHPGPPVEITFTQVPSAGAVGDSLQPMPFVQLRDAFGNAARPQDPVNVALASGNPLAGNTSRQISDDVPIAFPGLLPSVLEEAAILVASSGDLPPAQTPPFPIRSGPPKTLQLTSAPTGGRAGELLEPLTVVVRDEFGNVASDEVEVTVELIGGETARLGGTTRRRGQGQLVFDDLVIDRAGRRVALAVHTAGLAPVLTPAFDVGAGESFGLRFLDEPADLVVAGERLDTLRVEVVDAFGSRLEAGSFEIRLGLWPDSEAKLEGRTESTTSLGVAYFDDLRVIHGGDGLTLLAASPGLLPAVSAPFDVEPGPARRLRTVDAPTIAVAGAPLPPIRIELLGEDGARKAEALDVELRLEGEGILSGTTSRTAEAGLVTFDDLVVDRPGEFRLVAAAPGVDDLEVGMLQVADFPAPTLAITSPAAEEELEGTVEVSAAATMAPGARLVKLTILLDGEELASGDEPLLATSWDTRKSSAGAHVLQAVIEDHTGARTASLPIRVRVAKREKEEGGCSSAGKSPTLALLSAAALLARRRR